jgi:hypothetical protein
MKIGIICCLAISGGLWSYSAYGAQRNIFDDDWTPPKSSSTTHPSAITPIQPPVPEKMTPKSNGVSPSTPKARKPIPIKDEQSASRKVMKEVFSDQLAEHSIAARRKLSVALLAQADQSADKPADQFVLLAAAIDAALDAADLTIALHAADRMAKVFEVDEWALKTQTVAQIGQKNPAPDLAAENARAGMKLAADLMEAGDLASAARVYTVISPLAAANPELRAGVQVRQREVAALREAAEKVVPFMEKLRTDPQDPSANLEVGKYLCFFRSDWEKGLGSLARGNNPELKALALREISAPTERG